MQVTHIAVHCTGAHLQCFFLLVQATAEIKPQFIQKKIILTYSTLANTGHPWLPFDRHCFCLPPHFSNYLYKHTRLLSCVVGLSTDFFKLSTFLKVLISSVVLHLTVSCDWSIEGELVLSWCLTIPHLTTSLLSSIWIVSCFFVMLYMELKCGR